MKSTLHTNQKYIVHKWKVHCTQMESTLYTNEKYTVHKLNCTQIKSTLYTNGKYTVHKWKVYTNEQVCTRIKHTCWQHEQAGEHQYHGHLASPAVWRARSWYQFSKVSSIDVCADRFSTALTFENFWVSTVLEHQRLLRENSEKSS